MVELKKLPEGAKEMRLVLHIIRKEDWDSWNELKVYDFGSEEQAFVVVDRNYLRTPDPEEKYYFYFYVYTEDGQKEWRYVKMEKGTSMKGTLTWEEVKDKVREYKNGIYKIVGITEEGKALIGLPEFRVGEVEFLYEPELLERKRVVENEDVYVYVFENALIDEIDEDEKVYLLRPCKTLNTVIIKIKSKKPMVVYPIDGQTGFYKAEIRYNPSKDVSIYRVPKGEFDIVLKAYVDGEYKLIPI